MKKLLDGVVLALAVGVVRWAFLAHADQRVGLLQGLGMRPGLESGGGAMELWCPADLAESADLS